MAAKNKELETAKKNVETAKDALTAANNELSTAKSDSTTTLSAFNLASNSLKTAQANYSSVKRNYDTAETNLQKAKDKLATLEAALEKAKTEGTETTKKCGLDEQAKAMAFFNTPGEANPLWFKIDGDNLTLIVSTKEKSGFDKLNFNTFLTTYTETIIKANTYDAGFYSIELLYDVPGTGEKSYAFSFSTGMTVPMVVRVQMKAAFNNFKGVDETVIAVDPAVVAAAQQKVDDQEEVVAERQTAFDNAAKDLADAKGVLDDAQATYDDAFDAYEEAKKATATARSSVKTAQSNLSTANGEVTRIESEIATINDAINAVNNYKNLSITANITIKEPKEGETLLTLGDWGSDYTINGNGYVITYPAGAEGSLVGTNRGVINNLGVVNGTLATANAGSMRIAFETTDGTNYDIYDASGAHDESPMNGALAYRARPYFGVTINADGTFEKLAKKTADNTVYKTEWTDAKTKKTTTFYTNATANDLSYNPAKGKANTFAYVLDTDLNTTNRLTAATNVVANGICKNAVFTDGVKEGDEIYIPTDFTAEKLTYGRNFSSSPLATVCLPFGVSAETLKEKGVETKMQFSYVETATNTYWFQHLGADEAMNANEPYVLKFKNGFSGGKIFESLTNIEVSATKAKGEDINSLAVAPSNAGNGAEFLGVFTSTNASKLMRGGYTLYGFINGKFSPMDAPKPEDVKMLPFRTYVRTPNENNAPAAPFILGELDEDGNIVDDGGETAISTTEADAFSVRGINGALVITSDKAQKVNIYTIGGSLVKAMDVEAGSVTVPVAAGMYIVNGKKVLVK